MDGDDTYQPTWADLMSAIGSISVCWSFLEIEMRSEMCKAGLEESIAKGPIISHWRAYVRELAAKTDQSVVADYLDPVERVAATRNLVVHGIQSLSIDRYGEDGAIIVCAEPDGSIHKLTIEMLHDLARQIDRTRSSIQGWRVRASRARKRDRS